MGNFNTEDKFRNLNVWVLIAIILIGFALYINPLKGAFFCLDDSISIEHNEAIKQLDIHKIFQSFNSRFLVGLSFALNYQWGALNPVGYRLINLLVHCLNAFLVYLLIKSTLNFFLARQQMLFCRIEWVAFVGSVLFLCHPIQTEPVNYITQRFVLMGAFFYLLTIYLYVQYRCRKQKKYIIAAMIGAIAAMFCKEFAVSLPFMLLLYEFYFINFNNERPLARFNRIMPFFVIILIVPMLLLRTPPENWGGGLVNSKIFHDGKAQKAGSTIDITRARDSISRKQYSLTELNVMCTYVKLLFLPLAQNFDYDYPISKRIDAKTMISGVFLLCLLAVALVTFKSYRIVSFSVLWFFVALSVESSFIPITNVIAEYRLYLASVGFAFLVSILVYIKQEDQKRFFLMVIMALIGFSMLTYQRNKIWKDELALWDDTVSKSPRKARPLLNRGNYYFLERDNIAQAMSDYARSVEVDPDYIPAYRTLAMIYAQQGRFDQAIDEYTKALMIKDPAFTNEANLYCNRGILYDKLTDNILALSDFNRAIALDPRYPEAYFYRGINYSKTGKFSQAIFDFNKAIELNPNYKEAYLNRGIFNFNQGNFTQAVSDFSKVLEIDPYNVEGYYNRLLGYFYLKDYEKAWADLHKIKGLGASVKPGFISALKKVSGRDQ